MASQSLWGHDTVCLARLLETRRTLPPKEIKVQRVPCVRGFNVNIANRWAVQLFVEMARAASAEKRP